MLGTTILFQLRDAARTCPKPAVRQSLKQHADDLAAAITALAADPTDDRLSLVNGLWSRAFRMLGPEGETGGGSGGSLKEGALLSEAA